MSSFSRIKSHGRQMTTMMMSSRSACRLISFDAVSRFRVNFDSISMLYFEIALLLLAHFAHSSGKTQCSISFITLAYNLFIIHSNMIIYWCKHWTSISLLFMLNFILFHKCNLLFFLSLSFCFSYFVILSPTCKSNVYEKRNSFPYK